MRTRPERAAAARRGLRTARCVPARTPTTMLSPASPLYDWFGLNTWLFRVVNAIDLPLLDAVMRAASGLAHPRLYPFYVAFALWLSWRRPDVLPRRNTVVFAFSYVAVSLLLVPALKSALDFPRPGAVLGAAARVVADHDAAHALPSGHAAFAVLAACALSPGTPRRLRWGLAAFAVLASVSRVVLGAHFPADVVWGALLSALVVWVLRRAFNDDDPRRRGA